MPEPTDKSLGPKFDPEFEKYAFLDSLEGLEAYAPNETQKPLTGLTGLVARGRELFPGTLIAVVIGMAAGFMSSHYGGPIMFYALLIGMAFDFLAHEARTKPGIEFASKRILRIGVALLGARITFDQVLSLGGQNIAIVACAVVITILSGLVFARFLNVDKDQGLLSAGAVAICGASAALALSSVMPKTEHSERNTIFTVVAVTTLSTIAMVLYPIFVGLVGFSDQMAGVFLGGTIHDVAQVVGAGYTVSEPAGDVSTIVKLFRVAMLMPAVIIYSMVYRQNMSDSAGTRPPLVPTFLLGFIALVVINSLGFMPAEVASSLGDASRWCLVTAISALGMKTSFKVFAMIGWRPVALVVAETLLMAIFVLTFLLLL